MTMTFLLIISILSSLIMISNIKNSIKFLITEKRFYEVPMIFIQLLIPIFAPTLVLSIYPLEGNTNLVKLIWVSIIVIGVNLKLTDFSWRLNSLVTGQRSNFVKESLPFDSNKFIDSQKKNIIKEVCLIENEEIIYLVDEKEKEINAWVSSEGGSHSITFTMGSLELDNEEFRALVAHEFIHIKRRDATHKAKFRRITLNIIMVLVFLMILLIYEILYKYFPSISVYLLLIIPLILFYGVSLFIFVNIDNRRFWYQIDELYADRFSCEIENVNRDSVLSLLRKLKKQEQKKFDEYYWSEKMYYRYFILTDHPCVDRRIHLIEKRQKWGLKDYISHLWIITKWFFTGKGWNGM